MSVKTNESVPTTAESVLGEGHNETQISAEPESPSNEERRHTATPSTHQEPEPTPSTVAGPGQHHEVEILADTEPNPSSITGPGWWSGVFPSHLNRQHLRRHNNHSTREITSQRSPMPTKIEIGGRHNCLIWTAPATASSLIFPEPRAVIGTHETTARGMVKRDCKARARRTTRPCPCIKADVKCSVACHALIGTHPDLRDPCPNNSGMRDFTSKGSASREGNADDKP